MDGGALPIRRHRRALVRAVSERPFLIVTGETGSGKSTQLPKYLYEAGEEPRALRPALGAGAAPCRRAAALWRPRGSVCVRVQPERPSVFSPQAPPSTALSG